MNSKIFTPSTMFASALFIASSVVQAQEALPDRPSVSTSARTVAEIQAELAAANAAGLHRFSEATQIAPVYANVGASSLALTRAQVALEAREAQRQGLTNFFFVASK